MDESSLTQNRRSRRSPVLLAASIEIDGVAVPVILRNLSEQGALIEGEDLPPEGAVAMFQRNDLRLKSRVVWVEDRLAGVSFARPLKRSDVLRNVPLPKQWVRPEFRRPGLACRPLSNDERMMIQRLLLTPLDAVSQ